MLGWQCFTSNKNLFPKWIDMELCTEVEFFENVVTSSLNVLKLL